MELKCASFVAVSSEEQARPGKMSLDNQRAGNQAFVEAIPDRYPGYGGQIIEELEVQGTRRIIELSEAIATYPAYARLYELVQRRAIDLLVFARWDRLGRQEALQITIRDLCLQNGIVVAPVESPPPSLNVAALRKDEGWRVTGMIQAWGAGREVREIARRVSLGRRARVVEGRKFIGTPPEPYRYEYNPDGSKRIVYDKERSELFRWILLELYVEKGMGKPAIANKLNQMGILTLTGEKWMSGTVDRILDAAPVFAGNVRFGTAIAEETLYLPGSHPAFLTQAELGIIQSERDKRRTPGRRTLSALAGICICGLCGQYLYRSGDRYVKRDGSIIYYRNLRCRNTAGKHQGCSTHISEADVFAALRESIAYIVSHLDIEAYLAEQDDGSSEYVQAVAALSRQVDELGIRKSRLLDLYESGALTIAQLTDRIREREAEEKRIGDELASAQAALNAVQMRGTSKERIEQIRTSGLAMLDRAEESPHEVRHWLKSRLRVIVTDREVEEVQIL